MKNQKDDVLHNKNWEEVGNSDDLDALIPDLCLYNTDQC